MKINGSRINSLPRSNLLEGKLVLITGVGFRKKQETFYDIITQKSTHDPLFVDAEEMKLNIGAATAAVLALNGADVKLVSQSKNKLEVISNYLHSLVQTNSIDYIATNLLDEFEVKNLVSSLPVKKQIYWVHSVGLGAGSYTIQDDNPYLKIEDVPLDLIEQESRIVLRSTHLLMKELIPVFKKQRESRIALISSMSAVRGYDLGVAHCGAKGGLDRYANSAMLALYKQNIFLTTLRPGAVDTGLYDSKPVQEAVIKISKDYGCDWKSKGISLMYPSVVGEAVNYIFSIPAHIPSINLVARGQIPHEGS